MEKTRAKAKTKKTKWVTITFDCEPDTLKRLNDISKLAHTTLDQTVAVILSCYIHNVKEIKGEGFKQPEDEKWTYKIAKKAEAACRKREFGLGDK